MGAPVRRAREGVQRAGAGLLDQGGDRRHERFPGVDADVAAALVIGRLGLVVRVGPDELRDGVVEIHGTEFERSRREEDRRFEDGVLDQLREMVEETLPDGLRLTLDALALLLGRTPADDAHHRVVDLDRVDLGDLLLEDRIELDAALLGDLAHRGHEIGPVDDPHLLAATHGIDDAGRAGCVLLVGEVLADPVDDRVARDVVGLEAEGPGRLLVEDRALGDVPQHVVRGLVRHHEGLAEAMHASEARPVHAFLHPCVGDGRRLHVDLVDVSGGDASQALVAQRQQRVARRLHDLVLVDVVADLLGDGGVLPLHGVRLRHGLRPPRAGGRLLRERPRPRRRPPWPHARRRAAW